MKKKTIIWITIPLLLVGFIIVNWNYISQYAEWRLNWGFEVPKPNMIETVFNTRYGFPNEGQTFLVFDYNAIENKIKQEDGWIPINGESSDTVSNLLETFQKDVADINDHTQNFKRIFQENPVTYNNNDRYFYKLEDNSYILAISNTKEQKLFVMEWIQ